MIFQPEITISGIFLSVLVITYLILSELGNEKLKRVLKPIVIVLIGVFLIIAVMSIRSKL
jgi:hypothetical protein